MLTNILSVALQMALGTRKPSKLMWVAFGPLVPHIVVVHFYNLKKFSLKIS
jgi:hypothetical protein